MNSELRVLAADGALRNALAEVVSRSRAPCPCTASRTRGGSRAAAGALRPLWQQVYRVLAFSERRNALCSARASPLAHRPLRSGGVARWAARRARCSGRRVCAIPVAVSALGCLGSHASCTRALALACCSWARARRRRRWASGARTGCCATAASCTPSPPRLAWRASARALLLEHYRPQRPRRPRTSTASAPLAHPPAFAADRGAAHPEAGAGTALASKPQECRAATAAAAPALSPPRDPPAPVRRRSSSPRSATRRSSSPPSLPCATLAASSSQAQCPLSPS